MTEMEAQKVRVLCVDGITRDLRAWLNYLTGLFIAEDGNLYTATPALYREARTDLSEADCAMHMMAGISILQQRIAALEAELLAERTAKCKAEQERDEARAANHPWLWATIRQAAAEIKRLRESPTQECTTCERCFLEVLMRKDANGLLFCGECFAALERECEGIDAAMAKREGR